VSEFSTAATVPTCYKQCVYQIDFLLEIGKLTYVNSVQVAKEGTKGPENHSLG
jgi:hypothetical protein